MCSLAAHPSPAPLAVPATPTPLPTTLPHLPGDTGFPGWQRPGLLCELSQDPTGRTRPRCLACRQYLRGKRPISLKSPGLTVNLTLFLKAVKTRATRGDVTLTAKMLAAHTSPQPFQDATCRTSGDSLRHCLDPAKALASGGVGFGSPPVLVCHTHRGVVRGTQASLAPSAPRQTPSERPHSGY